MFENIWIHLAETLPTGVFAGIGIGAARSLFGWFQNSMADGKIDQPEWGKFFKTIVKYVAGISLLSIGVPLESSIAGIFALDFGTSELKKLKK